MQFPIIDIVFVCAVGDLGAESGDSGGKLSFIRPDMFQARTTM